MAQEIKVKLDDTYMNVTKFGTGSYNMLMIAGLSLTGLEGQGEAIAQVLSTFSDDFTVYLMDSKKHIEGDYSVEMMADDLYKVLGELGISKAYIYGVSQGGMVGQTLAIKHPELVVKLALCSTMARATELTKKTCETWLKHAKNHDVVSLNRSFFELVYSKNYLKQFESALPTLEKVGTVEDCNHMVPLIEACAKFDILDKLADIKCPVLAMGDKSDNVLGIEGTYEIIEKLGCKSYIYEGFSHAVYDEAPDTKKRVLDFFLEQ